jgi:hypothetical protein
MLTGIKQTLRQGAMISQLEFSSRAALCRKLAKQEPANRALWMAEAETWLRLSKERLRGEARANPGYGVLASLRPRRARYLSISVSAIIRKLCGETRACAHTGFPHANAHSPIRRQARFGL